MPNLATHTAHLLQAAICGVKAVKMPDNKQPTLSTGFPPKLSASKPAGIEAII